MDPEALPADRIYDILLELDDGLEQSFPIRPSSDAPLTPQPAVQRFSDGRADRLPEDTLLHFIQELAENSQIADIDISGAEFNFVRSIRVFEVRAYQRESGRDGDCYRSSSVRLGSYGTQGGYSWSRSNIGDLPLAHIGTERWGLSCPDVWHRSVFVEWRDYEGNYGFEQVNY